MDRPKRIQGTDGIRKEVISSKDPRVRGLSPLNAFLEKNFITEAFLELYAYAHVQYLIQTGAMQPGEEVVVGWDPRDPEGFFTGAVIRGIRKARGKAVVLGIIPTPAVPIYMIYRQAKGGLVITASHNPKDQNGVKIFLAGQGLKLFPADDVRLTDAVYETSREDLSKLKEIGDYENAHEDAVEVFLDFIGDPYNSWVGKNNHLFDGLTVIVDPANGAYVGIAATALKRLGIPEVIETNNRLDGNVNMNSGVADLEGIALITPDMVDGSTARFAHQEAIQKIFEVGRRKKQDILSRKAQVCGAVFDGDGDRFYRLEYNPVNDTVLVLSGDEVAFHQAKYLMFLHPEAYQGSLFVNTIESDLNAARAANQSGFAAHLTGVGDKWILFQAVLAWLRAYLDLLSKRLGQEELTEVQAQFDQLSRSPLIDSSAVASLAKAVQSIGYGNRVTEKIHKEITAELLRPGVISYAVGSEESGHHITLGRLRLRSGERIPVFAGNGLKSAVNTFVATRSLRYRDDASHDTYIKALHHPFNPGFKKTFYVYYTDKSKLAQGTEIWQELIEVIRKGYQTQYGEKITIMLKALPEESDTLYLAGYKDNIQIAGIFCRNSGTEDKTGVNVRGSLEDEEKLTQIGEMALRYLMQTMKDINHPYARAERVFLDRLSQGSASEATLKEALINTHPDLKVSVDRLLKEMGEKQKLVQVVCTTSLSTSERLYELTERGKEYVESLI